MKESLKLSFLGDDSTNYSIKKNGDLDRDLKFIGAGTFSNICDIRSSIDPGIKKIIRISKKGKHLTKEQISNIYLKQNEMIELQSTPSLFSKITPKIYSNKILS